MHLKRWLTGIIAVPILIYLIGFGPQWLLYCLIFSASLLGLFEFYTTTMPAMSRFIPWSQGILSLLLYLIIYLKQFFLLPAVIVLWAFVPMTYYMLAHAASRRQWTADMGKAVLGPVYIVLPLAMLIMIHLRPGGKFWIFFLLGFIFSNDTGAFYFGKLLGKRPLYKAVSPNKTWEGAIGGLLSSFTIGSAFLRIVLHQPMNVKTAILLVVLSIWAQVGDLVASMVKRNHGVKDYGRILPGHGGILDRIDGLLYIIPILYIYLAIWVE